jgi:hypothetical protein
VLRWEVRSDSLLPASIVLRAKGHLGLDGVVKTEKSGRLFKHGVDFGDADSMIDDAEEAYVLCCVYKFPGYVVNPGFEIGKGDCWYGPVEVCRLAHGELPTRDPYTVLDVMLLSSFMATAVQLGLCCPTGKKYCLE